MRFYRCYVALTALSLAGCPTLHPPGPIPPDAADAAPWSAGDAGPPDTCAKACEAMTTWCGPQRANCAVEMRNNDAAPHIRRPDNAHALTCADVATASSLAAMRAIGACP